MIKLPQLMLIVAVVLPFGARGADERPLQALSNIVRHFFFPRRDADTTSQQSMPSPQPMLVIGAGLGRTSKASFTVALGRLGLKSYHMEENHKHPSHMQLWTRHAKMQTTGNGSSLANEIIDRLAKDGYNATTDFPAILLYKEFMDRYPDAVVILTVRSHSSTAGLSWAKSMNQTLLSLAQGMERIPWRWTNAGTDFLDLMEWMWPGVGIGLAKDTTSGRFLYPTLEELAQTYDDWNDNVIASVPPEKLLVFAAKDGYKPLCDFLVSKFHSPIVEENCHQVLDSNEPYPYGNSSAFMRRIFLFLTTISLLVEWAPLWLVFIVLLRLRSRSGKSKND